MRSNPRIAMAVTTAGSRWLTPHPGRTTANSACGLELTRRRSGSVFITAIFLVAIALWLLYLRSPYHRIFAELKHEKRTAASNVKRSARRISKAEKAMTGTESSKNRLAEQHTKQQAALRAGFDRKKQKESHEIQSIDNQLAQLGDRKLQEITRRLMQYQQNFITTQLSQAVLSANDIPGVGAQLVARLHTAGVRTAADFTGIGYSSNGGSAVAYFHLTSGLTGLRPGRGEGQGRTN